MASKDVDTLCEILQHISREDAGKLLNITNGDVQTAVDKYYTTDDLQTLLQGQDNTRWDNTAFSADRYGQDGGSSGIPTFNIEYAPGVDNYPHSGGPSAAPTRPNSAASHRSSTLAGDAPRPSIENSQESGVIGGSGASNPFFGPATKEHYDSTTWAMVPTTKNTEYIPDALIWHQSRDPDVPAFIKPTLDRDYLPAVLTILHTIPLFRNAFLTPQVSIDNYWLGDDWWKGTITAIARTVDTTSGAGPSYELDLLYEMQRLMAFLDRTDRSYASLDSLFQLDAWKEQQLYPEEARDLEDVLLKFLLRWTWAYQQHAPDARVNGSLRSVINVGGVPQDSALLDANVVHRKNVADLHLYDVLDDALFDARTLHAHITEISDVIILRLTAAAKDGTSLDCTIPATLYADRYMEANKGQVDAMYAERKQYEEQLTNLSLEMEKVKYHKPSKETTYTKPIETLTMLKTSMKAFGPETHGTNENPEHGAVLAQLETLYQNIERKLSGLEKEKQKIQDALDSVSKLFRASIDDKAQIGDHPYELWGVATSSLDYFVLHPNTTPDGSEAMQWWHIKYTYQGEDADISRNRVTRDEVLAKARSDGGRVVLVYANKAATSVPPIPLSTPLDNFVKKDNLNFLQELSKKESEWTDCGPDGGTTVKAGYMSDGDSKVMDEWMIDDPPGYGGGYNDGYNWNSVSAKDFHEQDSGVSSTTLTPNTEVDDDGVAMVEMQEVNGGISAWAGGGLSNASSDALGAEEPMDISDSETTRETTIANDEDMDDADLGQAETEPEVEYIETVEKKGG
ncbi:hypothetical protein K458DRAFT_437083 [Lentithecium fluviatile CBS 122367]|uniref:Ubiquitin interaction motif protein n=1 Tax=Lentithecium fluviatile CBS 122367 TaxID=1168545 RepID=A0A6G1IEV5_9PLEO|nr:hypothetical protein K458DRAFT_437083 [Lentithecium fluviatile CBS 122367]